MDESPGRLSGDAADEPARRVSPPKDAKPDDSVDDRSGTAVGMSWAQGVISISLEMVLPGFLGVWLDSWLGTVAVFTVAGFGLGFALGLMHLLRFAAGVKPQNGDQSRPKH